MTIQISPKPRHLEPCEDFSRKVPACGGGGSVGDWGGQGLSPRRKDARGVGGRRDAHRAAPVQIRETISWSRFKSRPERLLQLIISRNGALLSFGRELGFALGLAPLTQSFSGWVSGGAFACTACPSCVVLGQSVPAGTLLLPFLCGKCGKA